MIRISTCNINAIEAVGIQIRGGRVSADIGFMIDSSPFGMASVAGLDDDDNVRDAADALQKAVEAAVAARAGAEITVETSAPRGLLDPNL